MFYLDSMAPRTRLDSGPSNFKGRTRRGHNIILASGRFPCTVRIDLDPYAVFGSDDADHALTQIDFMRSVGTGTVLHFRFDSRWILV
jgi:hypothetical protein